METTSRKLTREFVSKLSMKFFGKEWDKLMEKHNHPKFGTHTYTEIQESLTKRQHAVAKRLGYSVAAFEAISTQGS